MARAHALGRPVQPRSWQRCSQSLPVTWPCDWLSAVVSTLLLGSARLRGESPRRTGTVWVGAVPGHCAGCSLDAVARSLRRQCRLERPVRTGKVTMHAGVAARARAEQRAVAPAVVSAQLWRGCAGLLTALQMWRSRCCVSPRPGLASTGAGFRCPPAPPPPPAAGALPAGRCVAVRDVRPAGLPELGIGAARTI